jgi:hypothetical protein
MQTIKSLLFLTEADLPSDGPVAVEDLAKFFPSKHSEAIQKLWGTHRLTYKGKQFFDKGSEYGPVYKGAIETGEHFAKEKEIEVNIDPTRCDDHELRAIIQDAEDDGTDIPEFEVKLKIEELQEVYLGFNPKKGDLYIGFDAWIDHNDLDHEIDEYMNGLDGDDEELRDAIERAIMAEMKHHTMVGVLVELKSTDGENFTAGDVIIEPGGFYKGLHNTRMHGGEAFKRLGLIDLRLD